MEENNNVLVEVYDLQGNRIGLLEVSRLPCVGEIVSIEECSYLTPSDLISAYGCLPTIKYVFHKLRETHHGNIVGKIVVEDCHIKDSVLIALDED
ncbi:hypothetical protein H6G33_10160 [Calothrix sp. FACHB-1219]|uniref:hypothetical protein n=1 Tax=unclassified Calothrix TaxID=2619626 RepID=UPI001684E306|nr:MULTISPECIES: hypothetical protein [unclassified Calothrix]MBD2201711.1 hypothetical protein [Calothrix sp. FACHB-168]MBD2217397.1 hypothetical protein [Calothrix sp. FACHB-1219]